MHANEWMQRWQQGEARLWVEAHGGAWGHAEWQGLVEDLRRQGLAGLDLEAVGRVLERAKAEYWNLRRWQDSGEAWRWVVTHGAEWGHHDWMTLLAGLQCWLGPLDPGGVGGVLDTLRRQYQALRRWQDSGAPARWVEEHHGAWDHDDWLELLASLGPAGHADLDPGQVGHVLEECKRAYWNLRRWQESGEPYRWVEAHHGQWRHDDWLRLLAGLERSEFWPLAPAAAGRVLEEARRRYQVLLRWQQSGAARLWVVVRRGQWTEAALVELRQQIERSEQGTVEPAALAELLERLKEEYSNIRRWLERHGKWATAGIAGLQEQLPTLLLEPPGDGPPGRPRLAA